MSRGHGPFSASRMSLIPALIGAAAGTVSPVGLAVAVAADTAETLIDAADGAPTTDTPSVLPDDAPDTAMPALNPHDWSDQAKSDATNGDTSSDVNNTASSTSSTTMSDSTASAVITPARAAAPAPTRFDSAPVATADRPKRFKAQSALSRRLSERLAKIQSALDTPADQAALIIQRKTENAFKPLFHNTSRAVTNLLAGTYGSVKGLGMSVGQLVPDELMTSDVARDVRFGPLARAGSLHNWDQNTDTFVFEGDADGALGAGRAEFSTKSFANTTIAVNNVGNKKGKDGKFVSNVDAVVSYVLGDEDAAGLRPVVMAVYMVNVDDARYGDVYVAEPVADQA